ncbi:MAG: hypothetical protein HKN10_13495 [Myxococcales bacterium]|nr:hypothetical protein [Myxococcales bacterium]
MARLRSEGRALGYGCHVDASDWDGRSSAFSQIASPELILEEHPPVDRIEDFYRTPDYLHTTAGVRYTSLLAPLRGVTRTASRLMNTPTQDIRRLNVRRAAASANILES